MSPSERSLAARVGAHARAAQYDGRQVTEAGRAAFLRSFETQVDPDGLLPPAERARRAEAARKSYMLGLALKSAKTRRARRKSRATP
jgi:hypothetical protein